jgi:putative RNA 2'-phosphotransferase
MVRTKEEQLSKAVSYALRHAPWVYELEMDDEGWVSTDQLLEGLRSEPEFSLLSAGDLAQMVEQSSKKRHEIRGDRIRALYGHSFPMKLRKSPAHPPAILYHGTRQESIPAITKQGLRPMNRHYVHLSVDESTARQVALRKGRDIAILVIRAEDAASRGVVFYEGNEQVWLADAIPPEWITVAFST